MEKFSVTMDQMEDVGWEITACQKDLSALFHVMPLFQLSVLMEKLFVTMARMEDAG